MKKLLLIFCILASIFGSSIFAQTWVEDVYLNEDFSTATGSWVDGTLTQGYWTGATQSTTNTFTSAVNTTNKNVEIKTNVKIGNFVNNIKTFSGTGAPYSSPSGKVTVSFIVKIGAAQTYSGAYFYFRDNSNKPIFGLGFARINSGGNKWLAVKPTVYTEWVTGAAANYANITTPALLPTAVDGPGLKVNVVMDFTNHTYSMTATQGTYTANASPEWVDASPANVYTGTDIAFLDNAASNLSNILFEANGLQTSSSATATNFTFDNFKIAGEKTAAVASVTINYKDSEGNVLKSPRMQPDLEVGSTYTAPASDKETFSDASFYYAYNAATSTDNVVVAEGAVINLIFKKTPLTSGIYIWSGNANSNWNSADENFSVGTSPFIGYQDNNPILFPAVPVTKTVNLNANLTAGANDITMYGNGYSFSGTGSISGTGKFILGMQPGETATLGIKNNMSAYDINGGEAVITNNLGSAVYNLADGVKITLQTGAEFNKAITGTGTVTIQTNSNVFYNNTLTGPSTVNLILGVSGSLTGGVNWSSKVLTAMPANAQVNVTTNQATAGYGVAANSVQNSKLFLGDKVRLLYNYNPNEGGTTIISIGELTGAASASIEGGWVNSGTRGLNYYIGGLGTDATYNGVFKNYSSAPTAPLNIFKKGLGILTLISANPDWLLGNFNVDEGTIVLNGSIPGSAVPVTVATGAIIKGTGTVGGPATINGTLEGSLHFGSTLALGGTTNLTVTDIEAAQFDVLNVTGAVTNGGTLNINLLKEPTGTGTIKLIAAPDGAYSGTFTAVNINPPSAPAGAPAARRAKSTIGYAYDAATGVLSYTDLGTGISELNNTAEIYPTLTCGEVVVNAENAAAVDVLSLGGQLMKQQKTSGTRTTINLKGLAEGAYLVKVRYTDGTDKTQQVILRK